MGDVEIVVKVRVPDSLSPDMERAVRKKIAVDAVNEIENRLIKAKKFKEILSRRILEGKDAEKLAKEIGERVAKHYGVL